MKIAIDTQLLMRKVASRYVEKRVEWEAAVKGENVDEETLARRASILLHTTTTGFTQWLDSEPLRNDSLMRTASRTPQTPELPLPWSPSEGSGSCAA